ncbi:MAG: thioredoxin domain-containing protein, partial [Longimicrobiales bacterium]
MSEPERNALAGETSPFLQHGATQPVDWQPWGAAAFERARREDRPILLDIGAVWCHWCHVMDAESYDDAETATLINDHFVAIKVDRDERPDVDARYQRAVQLMTGQGGWPLTAFLTPDGDVFYGGTYFPPRDAHGRPSMRRVLTELARLWREERARALESVEAVRDNLARVAAAETAPGELDPALLEHTIEELAESFDFRFGGFGRAPKFPNAGALDLLLDRALDENVEWARRIVVETTHAMARGGIYDQLGGGFHRYATDAR